MLPLRRLLDRHGPSRHPSKRVEIREERDDAPAIVDDWKGPGAFTNHAVDRVVEGRGLVHRPDPSRELARAHVHGCPNGLCSVEEAHEAPITVHDDGHEGPVLLEYAPHDFDGDIGMEGHGAAAHGVTDAGVLPEASDERIARTALRRRRRALDRLVDRPR
jgi:hypothetical protein